MAMASNLPAYQKSRGLQIFCRKKDRERDHHPYKVIEITPPPKNLGVRCFPSFDKTQFRSTEAIIQTSFSRFNLRICNVGRA
eukprot:XP_019080719.1 PREDICTED: uncharacterized protein LOC100262706 isoform X2 [Vitis vinifera]